MFRKSICKFNRRENHRRRFLGISQIASNSIVQPQRGDTSLAPGERGEPLGEPSVTRGDGSEGFGGEGLCRLFICHYSNRNISYSGHWFVEGVVDCEGLFAPTQSIAWESEFVSALQAFRCHVNRHRGRIGPGKGCAGPSALVDHAQIVGV